MGPLLSDQQLQILKKTDTPTVCNVIEMFKIRPRTAGYMDKSIVCNFPKMSPMVGYATTCNIRTSVQSLPLSCKQDGFKKTDDLLVKQITKFIKEIPAPRVVVFQDLDSPSTGATFGELMCTSYSRFGCVGLVSSGAGRDLNEIEAIPFPVFTSGTVAGRGYYTIGEVNIPIHVGGLVIRPGDLIHGDRNGVCVIPKEIASEVANLVADFYASEKYTLTAINAKKVTLESWAQGRRKQKKAQADLKLVAKSFIDKHITKSNL